MEFKALVGTLSPTAATSYDQFSKQPVGIGGHYFRCGVEGRNFIYLIHA